MSLSGETLPPDIGGEAFGQIEASTAVGNVALAGVEIRNPIERFAEAVAGFIERLPFASFLGHVSSKADRSAANASLARLHDTNPLTMGLPDNWHSSRRT